MMKYIFCMLLGIFLISVLHSVFNKELQEFQTEMGSMDTSLSYNQSNHQISESTTHQDCNANHSSCKKEFNKNYSYNINKGLSGSSLSYRGLSSPKILRFNASTLAILTLSSLIAQQPKDNNKKLFLYTNITKQTYRYYIYTLGRILI